MRLQGDPSILGSTVVRNRMKTKQRIFERNLRMISNLSLSYPGWQQDREEAEILLMTSTSQHPGNILRFQKKIREMKPSNETWMNSARRQGHRVTTTSLVPDGIGEQEEQNERESGESSMLRPSALTRDITERRLGPRKGGSTNDNCTNAGFGNCVVCLDAHRNFAVTPCGHLSLCKLCASRVMRKLTPKCPICQAQTKSIIQIYLA
jgi:hypothetical protein